MLFALVNLSRHLNVDAEGALRRTIDKFTRRFEHVEKRVQRRPRRLGGEAGNGAAKSDEKKTPAGHLPLEVLDRYWDEAKRGRVEGRELTMHRLPEPTPPLARTPEEWAEAVRPSGAGPFTGGRSSAGCTPEACSRPTG